MSWGDPFSGMYKEDDDRLATLADLGITPGALVSFGDPNRLGALTVWNAPYLTSECFNSVPGLAIVISIDCETDPVNNWIYLLINGANGSKTFGWLPSGNVQKV